MAKKFKYRENKVLNYLGIPNKYEGEVLLLCAIFLVGLGFLICQTLVK